MNNIKRLNDEFERTFLFIANKDKRILNYDKEMLRFIFSCGAKFDQEIQEEQKTNDN